MATTVNMSNAKSSLSRLVKRAAAGEDIVIAKRGRPIALLTRLPARRKKIPWNIYKGQIEMAKDFDAPLDVFKDYM
jgi:antitoxin (DNA-binding transcriptional repressor) of toxin-antitoxin stability system